MSNFEGNTPIEGLSGWQLDAVEMAVRAVNNPSAHAGICRAINTILGDTGGPYSDDQVRAAIRQALTDCAGVYIPNALFADPNLLATITNQLQAAHATLGVGALLVSHTRCSQSAATALSADAALAVDADPPGP